MQHIIVGAMVGKLTKIAQGLSGHPRLEGRGRPRHPRRSAPEVGAPPDLVEEIRAAETARFAAERLALLGLAVAFHRALAEGHPQPKASATPALTASPCSSAISKACFIVTVEEDEPSEPEPCALIGILDDGWAGLSDAARRRLAAPTCDRRRAHAGTRAAPPVGPA
jgi:cobalt-precorrin-5B (C1)-methyltransferase